MQAINRLLRDALATYAVAFGPELHVELPNGSGYMSALSEVVRDLDTRLLRIFRGHSEGGRPVHSDAPYYRADGR